MFRVALVAAMLTGCAHAPPPAATPPETDDAPPASSETPSAPNQPVAKFANIPPAYFDQQVVAKSDPHLPDSVKVAHAGEKDLVAMFKVCANPAGEIVSVFTIVSIPGADDAIADTIRTWRLKPQPIGLCTLARFVFDVPRPAKKR
jgi:hypothetical protein